jgi:hypothetical protein
MVQGIEKRVHPRTEISSIAVLVAPERGGYLTNVLDISSGGVRMQRPLAWVDHHGIFRLYFIFDQDTVIEVRALMVRQGDDHLAFRFEDPQSPEVMQLMYETRFASQPL